MDGLYARDIGQAGRGGEAVKDLKFKAWDKKAKAWFMDGAVFDLNSSGRYGEFFFDNDQPQNMRDADLVWCQYTGLKDRNGADIFEGDIFQFSGLEPSTVVSHLGAFGFWLKKEFKAFAAHGYLQEILDDSVIIGNTYESKDPQP